VTVRRPGRRTVEQGSVQRSLAITDRMAGLQASWSWRLARRSGRSCGSGLAVTCGWPKTTKTANATTTNSVNPIPTGAEWCRHATSAPWPDAKTSAAAVPPRRARSLGPARPPVPPAKGS